MLVHQGARQFTLWTGVEAPREIMRAAAEATLAGS
jgi:shikimate 5-dehydrogenase